MRIIVNTNKVVGLTAQMMINSEGCVFCYFIKHHYMVLGGSKRDA